MHRFLYFLGLLIFPTFLAAQWSPNSVYREYTWVMPAGGEAFLRVGGRYGYAAQPEKIAPELRDGNQLLMPAAIDMRGATRAEVCLEKVQSHEDSRDLRISINGHAPIPVPEPDYIPAPQTEYMYHTNRTVPIPLDQLTDGQGIRFAMSLDTAQRWGWPQNVFYGLTFRIYYADEPGPQLAPIPASVPALSYLSIAGAAAGAQEMGKAADYILVGREVDWSGRGIQDRKHWQTHRGQAHHTLGYSTNPDDDFSVKWDTEWLPDQESFGVQARVLGADGKYRVSEVREGLRLADRPYRVVAHSSGPAPRNWVTRSGEFEQNVTVNDNPEDAIALQLNWVSWSPCYANGVYLNGHIIWNTNEDCYVFATHSPVFDGLELKYLNEGENIISTGLTPLVHGGMVHGMEVQWPGFQLKAKYKK
ncbi:hypothetical protein [Lewinella sp. 4G2]|uniref:hypothetical protein n=1 Tax=Lewinella sp. 4G2 TaxID=1803372 RepID=UPI0007B4677D|nr:hypothetical protein [Lewinella sp. 4G2]OAV46274.1 hypothetical protein A3850_018635 [Lewinella sp. 4G2]